MSCKNIFKAITFRNETLKYCRTVLVPYNEFLDSKMASDNVKTKPRNTPQW